MKISTLLKIKSVPKLFWTCANPLTLKPPINSVIFLTFGLIIFGIGEALLLASGAGVSPWTVFAQGISIITEWSVGFATFIVSCFVLILWLPLKQKPGLGTILNAIIIALVIDLTLPHLPAFNHPGLKLIEALIGVIVTGIGGGIYLIANLGPGPRDGLMTGLQKLSNQPLAIVRGTIEVSAVFFGWILGGTIGAGTLLFAFGIGPCVSASMGLMQFYLSKRDENSS